MTRREKIIWGLYATVYLVLIASKTVYFFSPQSQSFWYYQVLMAIDIWFVFPYLFNALSAILNALTLVPLSFLIMGRKVLSQRFWGYFFVVRLAMEFFGKSFEMKALRSYFYEDPVTAWATLGMLVAFTLPSYIGLYLYAFRPKSKLQR